MPTLPIVLVTAGICGTQPGLTVTNLRCEYLRDPLAIETPAPRLSWELLSETRGTVQAAYHILVAAHPAELAQDRGTLWDSGRVESAACSHVAYAGAVLKSRQAAYWKVRVWDTTGRASPWSAAGSWRMGLLTADDWAPAMWIADPDPARGADPAPPPCLRREFTIPDGAAVRSALLRITALGLYEAHLNGQRVGDHLLAPEWTDYACRVQYQTYDVTPLLRSGANALGVQLGDGWFCGRIGLTAIVPNGPSRRIYGDQPHLLLQLELEHADGRVELLGSDASWRSTTDGPVRASDILDGETIDATRDLGPWTLPGYEARGWRPVQVVAAPGAPLPALTGPAAVASAGLRGLSTQPVAVAPVLVAQPNEPIRSVADVQPVALTQPQPGVFIFDLGQNLAGWCRLAVRGNPGTPIALRHGEVLNPDGTLYTANLRSAKQTDTYLPRGTAVEYCEPRFTYHGFRYVEVTGLAQPPRREDLLGRAFCSAAPELSRFECSSPLVNKLMQNVLWTQRANLMSTPTDCPQRDERLGWMGDILAFAPTGCFNADLAAFLTKWLRDVRDAQTPDGRYPDFAPHPFDPAARFASVPAWGDAGVFVPWVAHVNYADRRLLEEHFESARRWVDYIHAKNPDLLWKNARGNDYGDWLNADTLKLEGWPAKGAEVPKEVFGTLFFYRSTDLVARMAAVLGRTAEAEQYAQRARDIRAAFQRAYVSADGQITGDTQAGYALALYFDILDEAQRPAAFERMLAGFARYNGQISTGFHSTVPLLQELTEGGRVDEAYRLLNNRAMPSWGYAIDHGATTIWERWDGYVEGRGFQDPGMNSFAHYAIGAVGEWIWRNVVGLSPDEQQPGYRHFAVQPRPGGGLTWARGQYHSMYGPIAIAWQSDGGRLTLEVEVPPNTTATVYVPSANAADVLERGTPAAKAEGVKFVKVDAGCAVFAVGSGKYRFEAAVE